MISKINEILGQKTITIKAVPNAKKTEIAEILENNVIKVKIAAPPVKGRANRELVSFLSGYLKISSKCITIVKGEYSRDKVVRIDKYAV